MNERQSLETGNQTTGFPTRSLPKYRGYEKKYSTPIVEYIIGYKKKTPDYINSLGTYGPQEITNVLILSFLEYIG